MIEREDHEGTAVLRLARPPVNALDLGLFAALAAALQRLAAAPPAGGLVIAGAGTCFSAGADLKALPGYGAAERARLFGMADEVFTRLFTLPAPTVAAVGGHALGGGLVLALCCDRRLAAAGAARIGLPEVRVGAPFSRAALRVVEDTLDPVTRRRLVLGGEPLDPAAALACGLLDAIVPPAALLGEAVATARRLAAAPDYAGIKAQLRGSGDPSG